MSGGHFEYIDSRFKREVVEKLYDDLHHFRDTYDHLTLGQHLEAMSRISELIELVRDTCDLLKEYDYAVSGDTSIEEFIERTRSNQTLETIRHKLKGGKP